MNEIDLRDRIAIVTGGSGGIGMATADRMLRSGAKVVVWDRTRALADAACQALPDVAGIVVDVTDEAGVKRATQETVDRFGRIDILVNAAGATNPRTLVVDYSYELWQRMIGVNLNGTFLCCREVVPHMQTRNYGRIVNLGSVSGKEGNPFSSGYAAAKAAVHSLTKSLAKELAATEIRVNAVAPAIIATKNLFFDQPEEMRKLWVSRVPLGRPGRPEEVAAMIAWLASEECSFSTGALFDLSGGRATY
jgi:NAD(P)-dependent dehydrogenase (short-subunit alcohol dehydrogenase family)